MTFLTTDVTVLFELIAYGIMIFLSSEALQGFIFGLLPEEEGEE